MLCATRSAFTHSALAAADLPIYTDALAGDWQDYSWDTTRDFNNALPVHSGSASIAVTYTTAWGGLLLHTDAALSTSGYTAIRFWVHGGSTSGQSVNFHITDGGVIYPFTVQANTWQLVTVPLAALGNPTTLSDLFWQDGSGGGQPTFYLDDISLCTPIITTITRVSVDSSGIQGNFASYLPSISADGRYVAFYSWASNLVSGDTNGVPDIFLRDTQTGVTTRVSLDSSGIQGNDLSDSPSISADGRYVAFVSWASNLISGDTNGAWDIFLRDTQTGTITRVSLDSSGTQGNGNSYDPSFSADGRYVAFSSRASNLVSGDTNGVPDIFLRDTQTGVTTRVSLDSSGIEGNSASYHPSISADGRYVAFQSDASNLVSGDTNGRSDVFLRDTQMGTLIRLSVDSSGTQGNNDSYYPSISADGRYVAFQSDASILVSGDTNGTGDVFLRDTQTDVTTRVSLDSSGIQGNDLSDSPSLSADGRYVAFRSYANNLVSGDTNSIDDTFLRDTQTGITTRLSLDSSGTQGNSWSESPSISADGRYVAFGSYASNLVSGDTSGVADVFVGPATRIFTLTVSKTGTGSGTVTSNPEGINCGFTCYAYFNYNTSLTLTATAATSSTFTGWSGNATGTTNLVTVTMSANMTITATFTLIPAPTITSFAPTSGPVGTSVTITGTNFAGATAVKFNGASADFSVVSATTISATVPTLATTGPISVTTPGGTAISSAAFTVLVAPGIPSLLTPPNGMITTTPYITFVWQVGAGGIPTGYNLQVDGSVITTTNTTSATVLSNGVHTWTARAYNAMGYSAWASPWSVEVRLYNIYLPLVMKKP